MKNYLTETFGLNDVNIVSILDEIPIWSAPFGIKLLDVINYKRNITALDIGCGTGFPLVELAQRLGASSKVYGIDPWTSAAERVMLKLKTMSISNVTLLTQEAETLPFEDSTFDLIVSNNGINNVQDAVRVLNECGRTLKQAGQFVMSVNLPGTMIEFYNVLSNILIKNNLYNEAARIGEHISSKRKSVEENRNMLTSAGFSITRTVEDVFYYHFSDGSAFLNYYFIRLAFLDSWKKLVPEEKVEEVFTEVENSLNSLAQKDGYLKLAIPYAVFDCRKN